MNKYEIRRNAESVWRLLVENKQWSFDELRKETGMSEKDLCLAIGWLAHEDKIQFASRPVGNSVMEYYCLEINLYIG